MYSHAKFHAPTDLTPGWKRSLRLRVLERIAVAIIRLHAKLPFLSQWPPCQRLRSAAVNLLIYVVEKQREERYSYLLATHSKSIPGTIVNEPRQLAGDK
jgi:hypothetical protein